MKVTRSSFHFFPGDIARWSFLQKLRNPFVGLAFFHKTNSPQTINLVSRHWPHLLCWSWVLSWNKPPTKESGFRTSWRFQKSFRAISFGPLYLSWQTDRLLVALGREKEVAQYIHNRARSNGKTEAV